MSSATSLAEPSADSSLSSPKPSSKSWLQAGTDEAIAMPSPQEGRLCARPRPSASFAFSPFLSSISRLNCCFRWGVVEEVGPMSLFMNGLVTSRYTMYAQAPKAMADANAPTATIAPRAWCTGCSVGFSFAGGGDARLSAPAGSCDGGLHREWRGFAWQNSSCSDPGLSPEICIGTTGSTCCEGASCSDPVLSPAMCIGSTGSTCSEAECGGGGDRCGCGGGGGGRRGAEGGEGGGGGGDGGGGGGDGPWHSSFTHTRMKS
mmetsp:Transcript_53029/g.115738  ORF Transcript_53029/g.115738 Transcript_53029/m.115738 type:complete len:261 (-) Transcript_53029:676-1458(-)